MKKETIKRRKRVVPAIQNQTAGQGDRPQPVRPKSFGKSGGAIHRDGFADTGSRQGNNPPLVDFTGYSAPSTACVDTYRPSSTDNTSRTHAGSPPVPSRRSASPDRIHPSVNAEDRLTTETPSNTQPGRLPSITSILNPERDIIDHRRTDAAPLTLRNRSTEGTESRGGSSVPGSDREGPERRNMEKRMELEREAQAIRKMLADKERELAELNEPHRG